jgi:hypothetical protein
MHIKDNMVNQYNNLNKLELHIFYFRIVSNGGWGRNVPEH